MGFSRWVRWGVTLGCGLGLLLAAACSAPAASPAVDDAPAATATPGPDLPDGVPVLDNAADLSVTADGSYIAYTAAATFDDTVAFYQDQLAANGWERINQNDAAFGSSTTLLRARPEANISVTIQSVPGDDNAVRVLISWTKK
jgi:hypothetical protein